jgi:hypothetical protein
MNLLFSKGEFVNFELGAVLRSNPTLIPEKPGVYAVIQKDNGKLVYIGQSKGKVKNKPRYLRDRFTKDHFKERARGSRLRRLVADKIGVPIYKDHSGHPAVKPEYESKITNYIDKELYLSFIGLNWDEVDVAEIKAIEELLPEWNIQHAI